MESHRPHPSEFSGKNGVSTAIHEVGPDGRKGIGGLFHKVFNRRSKKNESARNQVTARSMDIRGSEQIEASRPIRTRPPETQQSDVIPLADSSAEEKVSPAETAEPKSPDTYSDSKTRREQAESRLHKSAQALNQTILTITSTGTVNFRVPGAIGLQKAEHDVIDVPQTARSIEVAIDGFIDLRQRKVNTDSRAVWKSCAYNIFKAFYPYVKKCLSDVGVLPFREN
jgi:hypothetical protein